MASSVGLADASNIFTWTAQPFDWTAPDFAGVNLQADFQTDGSGHFDDDRVGWMITDSSTGSDNIFGVQMDPGGSGYNIEAYWDGDTFGDNGGRTSITDLPTLSPNAWYRLRAEITKLTDTSAMINVTLTALDASGNPGAVVASGSIPDTALLPDTAGEEIPNPAYFTGPIWPAYKNYTAIDGAIDNTCYEVVTGTPPEQYDLTVNIVGNGSVTLNPAGGTYYAGTNVQLTANPDSGWSFSNWSGDLSGNTNPASITMNSDKTVTATFSQQTGDLVGYWRFDEGTGTTAGDSSTYGNNGSINGASWTSGQVAGALSFDGANDYVQIPNSASLSLDTNRVTFAGWIYPTAVSESWLTVIQRSNTDNSWFDWQLYARASDAPTANRPVFRVDWNQDGAIDANEQVQGDIILQANTWYYIAATYDGTAMRFYIDGTLRGTTNIAGGTIPASNRAIWMGGNEAWGEYFPGRIDDFRIYNRALSQAEIQALMTPPTCYALTVGSYRAGQQPGGFSG